MFVYHKGPVKVSAGLRTGHTAVLLYQILSSSMKVAADPGQAQSLFALVLISSAWSMTGWLGRVLR